MSKSLELAGKFVGEDYVFDNPGGSRVIVGKMLLSEGSKSLVSGEDIDIDAPLAIKGEADPGDLEPGLTYRFFGTWASYFNRRMAQKIKQFDFRTFVPHIPHDRQGVIDYLSAAGRGNGIGPAKAKMLVDKYGENDVLDICRNRVDEIAEIARIDRGQAMRLAEKLQEQQATESATLEVDRLLHGRGFSRTLTRRVIKAWGNEAAEKIQDNPYALMQFKGVGFGLSDKLWIQLGKDAAAIERQALCLWYGMASDQKGHTWFRAEDAVQKLYQHIGSNRIDYRAAIIRGKEYGQLSQDHYGAIASIRSNGIDGPVSQDGTQLWLAEGRYAAAEAYVAEAIAKAMNETTAGKMTRFENVEHIEHVVLEHATCRRCKRQLTAPTVHVLSDAPYGPTCIKRIPGGEFATVYSLQDWLQANPVVKRWIEQQPSGIIDLPEVSLWPSPEDLEIWMDGKNVISDHQREQAGLAMSGRVGLLVGSPGTGKTSVLAAIINAVHKSGLAGFHEIGIGAPTGKAAVRLTEKLYEAGIRIKARTWHSLLGVGSNDGTDLDTGTTYKHGEHCKWPYKFIFGDETSMPPINIMAAIFKARAPHTHMLFVGDPNQLPPVGNGAPFRDMIAAGLPMGELKEIKRNSGGIVESCAAIRDEQPWVHFTKGNDSNIRISHDSKPEDQVATMLRLIDEYSGQYDAVWSIQVLTAVNDRSKLSRKELNKVLQNHLNPNPATKGLFRQGDKVVCLKNSWFKSLLAVDPSNPDNIANDNGEVYVANGELGKVEEIEEKSFIIRLESPDRLIQVFRGKQKENDEGQDGESSDSGCAWDLGYALSVHKYQGSEQAIVMVMLDTYSGAKMVCDRSWIYTAISRAKDYMELIGTEQTAERFCRVQKLNQRKTFLTNLIAIERFNLEYSDL